MTFAVALALLAIGTLLAYHLWKYHQLRRIIDKFHGPEPYWLIGNALHIKRDPIEWFEQSSGCAILWSTPRVYRIWFFTNPYVMVTGPAEVEPILTNMRLTIKTDDYDVLRPWIGRGLFVNEGEPWRPRRKMMTPAFHNDIIRHFLPVFQRQAKILVDKLATRADQGPFDIYRDLSTCALSVIWEAAAGIDMKLQNHVHEDYVHAIHRMSELVAYRQRAPWLWSKWVFDKTSIGKEQKHLLSIIHGLTSEVIEKRWQEIHETDGRDQNQNKTMEKNRNVEDFTMIDFWLEQVKKGLLTLKDVNEEANSLIFGGFDTTATSLNWALFYIGNHPEVQAKIHQELDAVLGDDGRDMVYEDLKNLVYLECCIKEALRKSPPAAIIGRKLTEDVVIAGNQVPSGTSVMIDVYSIHHDPNHWPESHRYIPERHLPENAAGRHPFAYIPFSAGIRNCIAQRYAMMDEKLILAIFLRRYKVKSVERQDQLRCKLEIILRPPRVLVEISIRR